MEISDKQTKSKKNIHSELVKISFNIPIKLNEKVKSYSNEVGLNYTSTLVYLLQQAIEQKDRETIIRDFILNYDFHEINSINLFKATQERQKARE